MLLLQQNLPAAQTLSASLFDNSQAFYPATVTPGAVDLLPELLSNSQAFYPATVSPGAVALLPELLSNSQAFYPATVTPGAVDLAASLVTNSAAFFSPTVAPGAAALLPPLYSNTQAFYAASIATASATDSHPVILRDFGGVQVAPSLRPRKPARSVRAPFVQNAAQFFSPDVIIGSSIRSRNVREEEWFLRRAA